MTAVLSPQEAASAPTVARNSHPGLEIRSVEHTPSPAAAFAELMAGNIRFVSGHTHAPRRGMDRRATLTSAQNPFAVVLGCSDSRVPAEILFDQGLGDLFVIRTAGHVLGASELGSVEYAVGHLHTPLIAVLGHDACGAVKAAINCADTGVMPEDHVRDVVERIIPHVTQAKSNGENTPEAIERAHAQAVMHLLSERSPLVASKVAAGEVGLVSLKYQLSDGSARLIDSVGDLGAR